MHAEDRQIGQGTLENTGLCGDGKVFVFSPTGGSSTDESSLREKAVVIVKPSRNLRDSILQSPDFLAEVFDGMDYGSRVVWLGRPPDSSGSLGSWEDKAAERVNSLLGGLRQHIQDFGVQTLLPAFQRIQSQQIP